MHLKGQLLVLPIILLVSYFCLSVLPPLQVGDSALAWAPPAASPGSATDKPPASTTPQLKDQGGNQSASAAQTRVEQGTLAAGTTVSGEHAIQTENAQGFATQTAAAAATKPGNTPVPTTVVTPIQGKGSVQTAPTPSSQPEDKIEVLGLSVPAWVRNAAIGIGALIVIVAVLGVLGTAVLFRVRNSGDKQLTGMAVGAFIPRLELVGMPGKTFVLAKSPATIGRGAKHTVNLDASVPNAETVSRQHARIERRGERYVLVDGAQPGRVSANGIFVNGKRTRENYLKDGDRIGIGQVEFVFRLVRQA